MDLQRLQKLLPNFVILGPFQPIEYILTVEHMFVHNQINDLGITDCSNYCVGDECDLIQLTDFNKKVYQVQVTAQFSTVDTFIINKFPLLHADANNLVIWYISTAGEETAILYAQ
jgi:hypothetical protein